MGSLKTHWSTHGKRVSQGRPGGAERTLSLLRSSKGWRSTPQLGSPFGSPQGRQTVLETHEPTVRNQGPSWSA